MRKYTRLVTVQGPTQLLNVLAVLDREDEERGARCCDDYLIIHELCTSAEQDILRATQDIARIREWKAVVNLLGMDGELVGGPDESEKIRARIGVPEADAIYASRNWQTGNEALLRAYSHAEKVLYGDGFGLVDAYLWPGFVPFDRAELCLPIETEFGLLDHLPYRVVPRTHLLRSIDRYLAASPQVTEYIRRLEEWTGGDGLLLLPTNATESGRVGSVADEVALYVEHVLRFARPGQKVVVKPHPRESLGQSEATRRILEDEHGIQTRVVDGYLGALPVEVLCREARFAEVLSLISVSALYLKYLYDVDCQLADRALTLPRIHPHYRREVDEGLDELAAMLRSVGTWDGSTILQRREPRSEADRNTLATAIALLDAERYGEALPLFRDLRAARCNLPQVEYGRAAALLGQGKILRGMFVAQSLLGGIYPVPALRLLERDPHARRLRGVARRWLHRLRRIRLALQPRRRSASTALGSAVNSQPIQLLPGSPES